MANKPNYWNQLIDALDASLGFPNALRSDITQLRQWYDDKAGGRIFAIGYRVLVQPVARVAADVPSSSGRKQLTVAIVLRRADLSAELLRSS